MVRHPSVYAKMLGERVEEHGANVWLINTGLTGGPYGTGHRINLKHTRAMVNAILSGDLEDAETTPDGVFGLAIPTAVPNVPSEVLNPRSTWDDPQAYDETARSLADMFVANFEKYTRHVDDSILQGGPVSASVQS